MRLCRWLMGQRRPTIQPISDISQTPATVMSPEARAKEARLLLIQMREAQLVDPDWICDKCQRLAELTLSRTTEQVVAVPPADNTVFLPSEQWRHLSNGARHEFTVSVSAPPHLELAGATFSSVDALFQGVHFNLPAALAVGGALDGDAQTASRLWSEGALQAARARAAAVATLDRTRRAVLTQLDSGLTMLACQLLMYAANEEARSSLLSTGEHPIEQTFDGPEGDLPGMSTCAGPALPRRVGLPCCSPSHRTRTPLTRRCTVCVLHPRLVRGRRLLGALPPAAPGCRRPRRRHHRHEREAQP